MMVNNNLITLLPAFALSYLLTPFKLVHELRGALVIDEYLRIQVIAIILIFLIFHSFVIIFPSKLCHVERILVVEGKQTL